jgi:putative methionine-R-sulfoxide reductase with GAF domain
LRIEKTQLVSEVEDLISSDAPDDVVLSGIIEAVHEAHPTWDWSGIYLLVDEVLVIGPFAGSEEPPDHARIEVGDGVCGTAVAENSNQLVADVRQLDNYLACSLHIRSELVVLIHHKDEIVGQFDIDSDTVGAFTKEDENLLEEISTLIAPRVASLACHMER